MIRSLAGRTSVVTGASSGIGLEAARGLARAGARVVLVCRDPARGEAARRAIGGDAVELELCDLAETAQVRALAARLRERLDALHVLVLNAGIWSSRRLTSAEGMELTWTTNVLAYHLLAEELLDLLRASAPSRVVMVASRLAYGLDLGDVQFERRPYSGLAAYAQSKQADRMLAWELARRTERDGVAVHAMHPGGVGTGIFAKGGGLAGRLIGAWARLTARSPEEGADTVVWLATDPAPGEVTGRFWKDRREIACEFRDRAREDRLAALCRGMASVRPGGR
jgi:NAD(P)-dependent dehydrogenase (short-subunit alcohol dehydrogenase family)